MARLDVTRYAFDASPRGATLADALTRRLRADVTLADIFKQARDLQERLGETQEMLKTISATGESGGGLVKVTLNGRFEALRVEIEPGLEGDRVVLEDLIAAAMNDAVRRVEAAQKEKMTDLAQRLGLPPGMNLPGGLSG